MGFSLETGFWLCAIGGTLAFVLQALLLSIGGHDAGGTDVDFHSGDITHGSDFAFKALSLKSITGFFMGLGWGGLAFLIQFNLNPTISFILAILCGVAALLAISAVFSLAMKLHSPGANYNLANAIGKRGSVYVRIPQGGKGQIQIGLAGTTREVDAISEDGAQIESFTTVEVTRAVDTHTVAVRAVPK